MNAALGLRFVFPFDAVFFAAFFFVAFFLAILILLQYELRVKTIDQVPILAAFSRLV